MNYHEIIQLIDILCIIFVNIFKTYMICYSLFYKYLLYNILCIVILGEFCDFPFILLPNGGIFMEEIATKNISGWELPREDIEKQFRFAAQVAAVHESPYRVTELVEVIADILPETRISCSCCNHWHKHS